MSFRSPLWERVSKKIVAPSGLTFIDHENVRFFLRRKIVSGVDVALVSLWCFSGWTVAAL